MQDERFSLGENINRLVTVMPFNANLKVHIRQFYVSENGETPAGLESLSLLKNLMN